jgi:hypothetical protein
MADEQAAIGLGIDREVDRHHDHRREIDEDVEEAEHLRHKVAGVPLRFVDRSVDQCLLLIGSDDRRERRESHDEFINRRSPTRDILGEPRDELPCLIDDRRHDECAEGEQREPREQHREDERDAALETELLLETVGDRVEKDGDQHRDEEHHQDAGDRSREPEQENGDTGRGESGYELDPPRRVVVRREQRGHYFLSRGASSKWASTITSPAPIAFGFDEPGGNSPIFSLSAVSC